MTFPNDPRALAVHLFAELAALSADPPGVTRASFGAGEDAAHALIADAARALGCEVRQDPFGNLIARRPGTDPQRAARATGSHLDSVPHGGNFDGAAGVVAGLVALSMLKDAPTPDVLILGLRAEEACWFPLSYPGSLALLGRLPAEMLQAKRSDTGLTLAAHLAKSGHDPDAVLKGVGAIDPGALEGFVEVHIEQGPVLEAAGEAAAIVTGIAGGRRYIGVTIAGEWAHSGAVPRGYRSDAVVAFSEIVAAMDRAWERQEKAGRPCTVTFGTVATDPALHGGSRVAGELSFTVDMRAVDADCITAIDADFANAISLSEQTYKVQISRPAPFDWPAAVMDSTLMHSLDPGGTLRRMPSGAGHDAATFADAGVPTGMIFVRNANGSHNPDEAMEIPDFMVVAARLADWFRAP